MGRVRRGGYIITWFIGDHSPLHVHVETDKGKLIGRLDLRTRVGMEGLAAGQKAAKNHRRIGTRGPDMKSLTNLKKPFGTARMVRIKSVRYLAWEDAFDVEFEDGLSFLEPHRTIRKANKISVKAEPIEIVLDEECRIGFEVRYNNGQVAEVSWSFVRELPPKR